MANASFDDEAFVSCMRVIGMTIVPVYEGEPEAYRQRGELGWETVTP